MMYQFKPGQENEILQGGKLFLVLVGHFTIVGQAIGKVLSTKAISLWKRFSRPLSASKCKFAKSRKWAPVIWKPKCVCIMFQTDGVELEFLTMVFLSITGQYLAICLSMSSRKLTFFRAIRRWESGTISPTSVKLRRVWVLVIFSHVIPSARNGPDFAFNSGSCL